MAGVISAINCFSTNNVSTITFVQKLPLSWKNHSHSPKKTSVVLNSYNPNRRSSGLPSLSFLAPLDAVLFDIDGTLCDSDPFHYYAFRDMLQEIGFNGGTPLTHDFFKTKISGKHNQHLCELLLPGWDFERAMQFMDDKEARFRSLASERIAPLNGLAKLCKWIEDRGFRRAAVTNAPKPNADLLITRLGLKEFFEIVVLAEDCERVKPFPDSYLKALKALNVSPKHTLVFEDSVSGIKAGVAAGMPVVGLATTNPEKFLLEAGASFVIKDFNDLKLWTALEGIEKKANIPAGTI